MTRIDETFEKLEREGRKGFIPFISAGDPDLDTSLSIMATLAQNGADLIELGVPFSDPMADGPTIQASSQRALDNGTTLAGVLELARNFRRQYDTPTVLFSYFNPLLRYGIEALARDASAAGVNGILVTDVIDAEAAELKLVFNNSGLDLISLIAPTTTDRRLEPVCGAAQGFIYAVARSGVTGAASDVASGARSLVERARKYTDLPIAVGFGISTAEQIREVWEYADAAVVGSAIVAEIEKAENRSEVTHAVEQFVSQLLPSFAKIKSEL